MNKFKNNKKTIFTLSAILILLIILIYYVFIAKNTHLDTITSNYILNIRNENLTDIMISITNIGGSYALIAISVLLLFTIKNKKIPISIIINLIIVFIISQVLKLVFYRPRPIGIHLVPVSDKSFPSGHTMVSIAYFYFLAYLIYKNAKNKVKATILIIPIIILPIIIAFSRIYLGVHFLTDIIGGFLFGLFYLITYITLYNKITTGASIWK